MIDRIFPIVFSCLCWLTPFFCAAATPARPNIAIFILDDVGQSDLGTFGHPVVKTPHLDRLAQSGVRFDNAFLTTSSCSPSRASILTGLYPHNTGAPNLGDPVPADIESLPRLLKQAGYYTASVGKWHLGNPFKSHFDKVVEPSDPSGSADWLRVWQQRPTDQPFFFWFASLDAHTPYDWHPPLKSYSPDEVRIHPWSEDNPYERSQLALYYNEITRADYRIGQMLTAMQNAGVLDNTLVIVLTDNGAAFGSAKTTLYDEGIRTPLIVRYPPRIKPGVNKQLVSVVDLMPTLLELTGLPQATKRPGVSLWPTLENPDRRVRAHIYAERHTHGAPMFGRAVRTERYLFIRNYLDRRSCDIYEGLLLGKKPRDRLKSEFYDLQTDPSAQNNLVRHPEYQVELQHHRNLMNWIQYETHDKVPPRILEQCYPLQWGENIQFHWPVDPDAPE
jgi:N-sulfoglucosamine sulfohydrolase